MTIEETIRKADASLARHHEQELQKIEARLVEDGVKPEEIESAMEFYREWFDKDRKRINAEFSRELFAWRAEGYPPDDRTRPTMVHKLQ